MAYWDVDPDVFQEFKEWLAGDISSDPDFDGLTAEKALEWAWNNGCLDDVLSLSQRGISLREFISIRFIPSAEGDPFPTSRRVGGDHDRGFSRALNEEMGRRAKLRSDPTQRRFG